MKLVVTKGPADWKAQLALPELHWQPLRSAMETALAWEAQAEAPPEIAALFAPATLVQAIVEYPVALPGGDRASFNDVFALFADDQGLFPCIIEAKRDEPFGPRLKDWLAKGGAGRDQRLDFLCETLRLDRAALPGELRYQLLHRTASAVLTARTYCAGRAAMVVQSFSPEYRSFEDFAQFVALFDQTAQRGGLVDLATVNGVALKVGWVQSEFRSGDGS